MIRPPRSKKLILRVRPGVLEVRARVRRPVSALRRLDLPTFDLPAKAISRNASPGGVLVSDGPVLKRAARAKRRRLASVRSGSITRGGKISVEITAVRIRRHPGDA